VGVVRKKRTGMPTFVKSNNNGAMCYQRTFKVFTQIFQKENNAF
jgi:hypothetical protein